MIVIDGPDTDFPSYPRRYHGSDYFLDDIVRDMRGNSYILFVWI